MFVKNCKTCSFSPPKMNVLWLHIEKDHQYKFQCSYCNNNYNYKNLVKTHKREVHYKGTFSCLSVMTILEFTKSLNRKYRNCVKCKSRAPKQKCTNTMMKCIRKMSTSVQCVQKLPTIKYYWPTI